MEHWFDRLSQPHTRRATVKAAALAGAALVLPVGRLPLAWATKAEPCYADCYQAAVTKWKSDNAECARARNQGQVRSNYVSLLLGSDAGSTLRSLTSARAISCDAFANVAWHQAAFNCKQPECGDPGLYPGGNAPGPAPGQCDPTQEIPCGDGCCNNIAECCQCGGGRVQCCATGRCGSCCGTP